MSTQKPTDNEAERRGNAQVSRSVNQSDLYEITKGKLGALGSFGFEEFCNGLSSQDIRKGGSNVGSNNAQRHLGSNMDSGDDFNRARNDFNNEKNELLSSQNPKKDGPLHTRIFIDAFLPSLEGNRIFPLFSYSDIDEKNRKRSNKQLSAVSSATETECGNDNRENTTAQQVRVQKELQNMVEIGKVEELRNVQELQNVEELQNVVKLQKVEQSQKSDQLQELNRVEENQKLETVQELGQKEKLQKDVEVQGLDKAAGKVKETEEVSVLQEGQKLEERKAEVLSPSVATNSNHPDAVVDSIAHDKIKSNLDEKKPKASENVNQKTDQLASLPQVEPLSTEEEKLLQKLFRALLENQELIDFLCEKVISKIASRNDFCGSNCNSSCGGLNKAM